ncbi:DUF421 domain-containing protein [Chitinophaga sp. S165]|uniref:DUF421 domain-containing protein n=1 Tax=Chitinophaga sp. S165 TaxID=2135462 RepID=UPI000D70C368|nr:YetF domain-containing protein [Chitinophaga sp. S165]PWV56214.1 uncharacterized membrane protein YcaP (DUF421 family) [Chitinophaga sp. S165]
MKSYEILVDDWMRIFMGNVPVVFFMEVIFRVLFVFLLLIISMRIMGKRMASQLSRNEMVAMSSLAAAIGIPIQAPDRGLLPAFIVAVIVILGQRWIARIATTSERFERISQGDIGVLVFDGTMNLREMLTTRISRERLFSQLRSEGIKHLGQVSRFYFEANGTFTLINSTEPKPGLSIMPEEDEEMVKGLHYEHDQRVCYHCGNDTGIAAPDKCPKCDHDRFTHPVNPKDM